MEEKTEQPVSITVKVPLQNEAPEKEKPQKSWKPTILYIIWLLATIGNTFLLKILLRLTRFELTNTILVVQLASISLYSWIFRVFWCVPKNKKEVSSLTYWGLILPIAISIFTRTKIMRDSLIWTTPISDPFSLGVEALYPVCLLVLGKKFLGEESVDHASTVLIGTLGGGFVLAYFMWPHTVVITEVVAFAIITAFEMIYSKKVMQELGIHPLRLLSVVAGLVLFWVFPSWLKEVGTEVPNPFKTEVQWTEVTNAVFIFGALTWVQTAAAFGLLSVLPVHHYIIGSGCNRLIRIFTFMLVATYFAIGYSPWDFEF